jgi:F-type H+-transporting ATPase subunit delta
MSTSRVIFRYADAFFMFAQNKTLLDKSYKDARLILNTYNEHREFRVFLDNPVIPGEKKLSVIKKVFANKAEESTFAFVKLIIDHKRENLLEEVLGSFIKLYLEKNKIIDAEVTTAVPLDQNTEEKLKRFIAEISGYDDVELNSKVKEDLIGGFQLKFNDKLLDASVKHELERIAKELTN